MEYALDLGYLKQSHLLLTVSLFFFDFYCFEKVSVLPFVTFLAKFGP